MLPMYFLPTEGDEKMRASQLIAISTVAVLMGGTSLALGQAGGTASSGVSERGKAMSSERGRAVSGERSKALTAERGRAVSGERGQALTAERGVAMTRRGPGELRSRPETTGLAQAYASTRSPEVGLNVQQRMRLYDILSARRDIPLASNVAGDLRVNGFVPRGVRLAAVPAEV